MAEYEGEFSVGEEKDPPGTKRDRRGVLRDAKTGRVIKGSKSPNPAGRPKEDPNIREIGKVHTEAAMLKLVQIMNNAEKERDQLEAAKYLLDRTWGKPSTSVQVSNQTGESRLETIQLDKLGAEDLERLEYMMDIAKAQHTDPEEGPNE